MPPTAKDLTIATQLLTATVATTPRASAVQIPAVTTTAKRTTITVPTPTTNNQIDIIAAFRATCKGSLTRELKTALTKVAFQQWRIVTQDTAIQEAKLKIMQETPVAAIPTAPLLSESSATTITCTIPAPIPTSKSTIPVHIYAASTPTGSTTTTSSLGFLHSLQGKPISGTTDRTIPYTPNITFNEECSKHLVTANIAGSPSTMACPATRNAQAVTNAARPIANARATFPNTENQPKSKTSYKEILIKNMCNNTHNAINALTKHRQLEPVLLLPTTASTITATASKTTAQTTTQKLSLPILPKAPRSKVASTKFLTSTRTLSGIHTPIITTMTLAAKQDSQAKIIQESSLSQQLASVTTTDAVFTSKTTTLPKSKPVELQLHTSPTRISAKKATSSKPNQMIISSTDRSSTKYTPTGHTDSEQK